MKRLFIHSLLFRIVCPPLYGMVVYVLVLLVFDSTAQLFENFFSQEVLLCVGLAYLLSEALRGIVLLLDRTLPAEANFQGRVVVQTVVSGICSLLVVSGGVAAYFTYVVGYSTFRTELITLNVIYLLSSFFYTMLYFGLYYLNQLNVAKIEEEAALRQKMEHQLHTLRKEINPDLLYTSMETLLDLLHQDPELADSFIDRLASVYRYSLQSKQRELAQLAEEVKLAHDLVYLYNFRHGGHIQLHLQVEGENGLVVPGTLGSLVEQAIQSTLITERQPLHLTCHISAEYLELAYRPNERLVPCAPSGTTVEDINHAYTFFTDETLAYQHTPELIRIRIPLLLVQEEKEQKNM